MTSKQAWEQFMTTGRVSDYMVYRSLIRMETLPELLGESSDTPQEKNAQLMMAAEKSDEDIVNALLDFGADTRARDGNGKTALDYARTNPGLKGTIVLRRLERLTK